jgi:hypothetical protein
MMSTLVVVPLFAGLGLAILAGIYLRANSPALRLRAWKLLKLFLNR